MPDDPTKPEMLSAAALDEAAKLLFDSRLSDETKGRIARDLAPSLLLMARAAIGARS